MYDAIDCVQSTHAGVYNYIVARVPAGSGIQHTVLFICDWYCTKLKKKVSGNGAAAIVVELQRIRVTTDCAAT